MTSFKNVLLPILILVAIVGISAVALSSLKPRWGRAGSYIDLSRDAVIKQMIGLNRLETASFTIEKIIEAGTQGNTFQEVLYGDRILLIANGTVIAGVDLSKISDSDVEVQGTTLHLQLPPAEILVSSLNSEKTRVYDRRLGLLSKGDKDLEANAREQAEAAIRQAACEGLILEKASEQADMQLTQLFKAAGFTEVDVTSPQASCAQ